MIIIVVIVYICVVYLRGYRYCPCIFLTVLVDLSEHLQLPPPEMVKSWLQASLCLQQSSALDHGSSFGPCVWFLDGKFFFEHCIWDSFNEPNQMQYLL